MRNKITIYIMIAMLSLTFNPIQSQAATASPTTVTLPENVMEAKVRIMVARLYEINKIDKSEMSASEKRALRREVKAIQEQMKIASGGGVYISAGAVILIIILLIILF
jgi:predicted GTPase